MEGVLMKFNNINLYTRSIYPSKININARHYYLVLISLFQLVTNQVQIVTTKKYIGYINRNICENTLYD